MYKGIKSEFVRNKIKGAKWNSKGQYIADLVALEQFVLKGPQSCNGAMCYESLKREYKQEFKKISNELDPKVWKEHIKRKREQKEYEKKCIESLEKREEKAKKEWVEAGGIL